MSSTVPIVIGTDQRPQAALAVFSVDALGNYASGGGRQETFTLVDSKSTAGDYPNGTPSATTIGQIVYGGDYAWTVLGTLGSGGSVTLKAALRNASGTILGVQSLVTKTAADTAGGTGVTLGSNAEIFVTLAGSALSNVSVQITRIP